MYRLTSMRRNNSATLQKAIECLEVLSTSSGGLSISQLVEATGISRQALGRLIETLANAGYVVRTEDKTIRLGLRLFDLTRRFVESATPLQLARREMALLVQEIKRPVSLIVLESDW